MAPRPTRLERYFGPAPEPSPAPQEPLRGLPPGEWADRGVYRMETRIPYGGIPGIPPSRTPEEQISPLAPFGAAAPLVFLDLETTGLAGGAGTYAFLCGLGWTEGEALRVVQFFLTSPAREGAWLDALARSVPEGPGFVTYNGRVFDLPLLTARFALHRSPVPWRERGHLDLLPLARHYYRGRLPSCRLGDLETHVLGRTRESEDVPGSLVPALYARFLDRRDASDLGGVFSHNREDLVSLAALVVHLGSLTDLGGTGREQLLSGNLWAKRGQEERAATHWRRAAEGEAPWSGEALTRLGLRARADRPQEALRCFEAALVRGGDPLVLLEELAKLHEHRTGDLPRALERALQALEWADRHRALLGTRHREVRAALAHRIERLRRRGACASSCKREEGL